MTEIPNATLLLQVQPEQAYLIFLSKENGMQAASGKVMNSECMNESKRKGTHD